MTYTTHYGNMYATALTPEFHEKTCNYWYTVTCGACAHTAFTTLQGLMRWLDERGLTLDGEMPQERGEFATMRVIGEYYHQSHGEFSATDQDPHRMVADEAFGAIVPVVTTATLSNGDYTLALISEENGVRTVHTLNPNVKTRTVYDHFATRELMDGPRT